ncbi:MAG: hypothetical protein ACFFFT_19575 [Candidatus Thorarchaeota archaeon]
MVSYQKLMLIVGVILLFVSLFLEWYSFQVVDLNNELIASWSYNLFFEWTTEFPSGITVNEEYRPLNLRVPIYINILFIITLVLSVGVIISRDSHESKKLTNTRYYSYIFGFLLAFTIFYVVLFPSFYLYPNKLYFPVVVNVDRELGISKNYSIGTGYILQLIGFILIFPYSLFYILSTSAQERNRHLTEIQIEKIIEEVQEPVDIDECIAEEELLIKKEDYK